MGKGEQKGLEEGPRLKRRATSSRDCGRREIFQLAWCTCTSCLGWGVSSIAHSQPGAGCWVPQGELGWGLRTGVGLPRLLLEGAGKIRHHIPFHHRQPVLFPLVALACPRGDVAPGATSPRNSGNPGCGLPSHPARPSPACSALSLCADVSPGAPPSQGGEGQT